VRQRDLILGLVQGPAELLPVSSSAHARLLGAEDRATEVSLHAGSALAALATRPRIRPWFAALTVAPPALAALLLEDFVEERSIAAGLLLGSAALCAAEATSGAGALGSAVAAGTGRGRTAADARPADALAIGVAQAVALWPGISRSAAALIAARARGFGPQAANELSREAWLPVLLAATARVAPRLRFRHLPGAAVAALSTAAALALMGPPRHLRAFAAYRTGLAVWIVWQDRSR
jgi:undecaprenyl-diphosphatase